MFPGFATTSKGIDLATIISNFAPLLILPLIVTALAFFVCLYIYKRKPFLFDNVSYDFAYWGVVRHGEKTEFSKPWRDITKSLLVVCWKYRLPYYSKEYVCKPGRTK